MEERAAIQFFFFFFLRFLSIYFLLKTFKSTLKTRPCPSMKSRQLVVMTKSNFIRSFFFSFLFEEEEEEKTNQINCRRSTILSSAHRSPFVFYLLFLCDYYVSTEREEELGILMYIYMSMYSICS